MANKRDYYEVLGVSKSAAADELKKAYRKQALEWHPDRNKTAEAESRFKEINEAYEILGNPEKRQTYDQFGHSAFHPGATPGGGAWPGGAGQTYRQGPFSYSYTTSGNPFENVDFGGFSDPFEIFAEFFGGGNPFGRRAPQKLHYSLKVDFIDAVKGSEKTVTIEGKEHKIKIPPGSDDGTHLRFSDFDISISVARDPKFRREGADIYIETQIPFTLAILGGTIDVPTVWGNVKLKVRPGTQPGTMVRLRGQGAPNIRGSAKGDEYVHFVIKFPDHLSRRQRELLEEFN